MSAANAEPAVYEEPTVYEVIEEAWAMCKAMQSSLIGKEPSPWRFIAHANWKARCRRYGVMTPSKLDLQLAGRVLGASTEMMLGLYRHHRNARRFDIEHVVDGTHTDGITTEDA